MTRKVVVVVDHLTLPGLEKLKKVAASASASVRFVAEKNGWTGLLDDAEVAIGLPPVQLVEHSALRFLQLHSSGFDAYLTPSLSVRPSLQIANARGVTAQAVAEHCLSMIFAFSRKTIFHARNQDQRIWQRATHYQLLSGSTITIIGTGAIGSSLGRVCRGIGMNVLAVQRRSEKPEYANHVFPFSQLGVALSQSKHLALALPRIPMARPLIGAEEIHQMPAGSFLYNVGRASTLDYRALASALNSGQLAGAGLDVFPEEPLDSDDPLWQRENVLISPHAGGRFAGEMDALADLFARNLTAYFTGQPLQNVVLGQRAGSPR